MINFEYLKNLNSEQKKAVIHTNGPVLIVAGAGSGKTKVLTARIAHIIKEKKAFPNQILSVTFTNKAAKEMQNRVSEILKTDATGLSWLGTFHSICAKLLRKHAAAAGLNSNFTILDTDDQIRLVKNICKSQNIDVKKGVDKKKSDLETKEADVHQNVKDKMKEADELSTNLMFRTMHNTARVFKNSKEERLILGVYWRISLNVSI